MQWPLRRECACDTGEAWMVSNCGYIRWWTRKKAVGVGQASPSVRRDQKDACLRACGPACRSCAQCKLAQFSYITRLAA